MVVLNALLNLTLPPAHKDLFGYVFKGLVTTPLLLGQGVQTIDP
jgi:hypothetical protein